MKNWYSICALNEGAEISIYDEIGAYGVSAKAFLADLGNQHAGNRCCVAIENWAWAGYGADLSAGAAGEIAQTA